MSLRLGSRFGLAARRGNGGFLTCLELLAIRVTHVGCHCQRFLPQFSLGSFSKGFKPLAVITILRHFVMQDGAVFCIDSGLHVIGDTRSFWGTHHSGIAFVRVELLQPH